MPSFVTVSDLNIPTPSGMGKISNWNIQSTNLIYPDKCESDLLEMMLVLRSHKYHSCHITDVEEKDDEEEEVPFESSDKGNHVYYDSNTSLDYDSS